MKQISRVLAAVDFSTPAREAFNYALALSKRRNAELAVVHAVPARRPFSHKARERMALLARLRQQAEQTGVPFMERVQHGDPAEMILLHAQSFGADVIVMGTHQRSGFERLRAGSVSNRVLAGATVPVLVLPDPDTDDALPLAA
jgi:nucleotide-binding universal stress UspA family protein